MLTSISETPVLVAGSPAADPTQLTFGPEGYLWFTEPAANETGSYDLTTLEAAQHPTDVFNANPSGITAPSGSSGAIYYTMSTLDQVGSFTPGVAGAGGYDRANSPPLPAYTPAAGITSLAGNIWYTVPEANSVEDIVNPTGDFNIEPYSLSPANIDVPNFQSQITPGPDGTLWFTEPGAIGVFSLSSDSVIGQVSLPASAGTQMPVAISSGPDNTIWFTESVPNSGGSGFASSAVGVINAQTQTYIEEFPTPAAAQPAGITQGPDGNMWFTETGAGAIGFVNVSGLSNPADYTLGTAIPIPTTGEAGGVLSNPAPVGITSGPNDTLWFADQSGAIGVVNLDHLVVTAAPPSKVTAGTGFGFSVTAKDASGSIDTQFNGTVTVSLASNPGSASSTLGGMKLSVTAASGVATFSGLTLDIADGGYTLMAASTDPDAPAIAVPTSAFRVVPAAVTNLQVTAQPPGTVTAGQGFGCTVVAKDQFGNVATNFSGPVTVSLANKSGGSGTGPSSTAYFSPSSATPGYATFSGLSVMSAGTGYMLDISLRSGVSTSTHPFTVMAPPPAPPTIIAESAVISQKTNNKGKKIGKPALSGYTITFSTAMDQAALSNSASYQVELLKKIKTTVTKVAGKKIKSKVPLYKPVGFAVTNVTSDSVTLTLAGKQTFPKGGTLTVYASSIDDADHVFLAQNALLLISSKGKAIS